MLLYSLVPIAILLGFMPALGLIIGPPGSKKGLAAVCEVRGAEEGMCSGVLIAPQRLLLSAHCLTRGTTKVYCNQGKDIRIAKSMHFATCNHRILHNQEITDPKKEWVPRKDDFAVVELDSSYPSSLVPPITLAKTATELQELARDPSNCIHAGYSRETLSIFSARSWKTAVPGTDLRTTAWKRMLSPKDILLSPLEKHFALSSDGKSAQIEKGDSGGPLLCRNKAGDWRIIAIQSFRVDDLPQGSVGFSPWVTNNLAFLERPETAECSREFLPDGESTWKTKRSPQFLRKVESNDALK